MHKYFHYLIKSNYFLIFIMLLSSSFKTYSFVKDTTTVQQILPGVIHTQIINEKDTLIVNILSIDLKNPNYKVESIKAHDLLRSKETTSHLCGRLEKYGTDVVAGINADFWSRDGEIINNMISNGEIVKAVAGHADDKAKRIFSQFALTVNNIPMIEEFKFSGSIKFKNGLVEKINRINSRTDSSTITLYNHYEGTQSPRENKNWNIIEFNLKDAGVRGDTLLLVAQSKMFHSAQNTIPTNGFLLSANNEMAKSIERAVTAGDTLKAVLSFFPAKIKLENLSGGLPRLVKDGINLAASSSTLEGTSAKFSIVKHPRTGVGFSQDSTKLFFITVDGRQESSSGISLKDFGQLMINNGFYQGMNLDGGGSTTMVINGEVVNSPSDKTGERPVGSCLILVKKK